MPGYYLPPAGGGGGVPDPLGWKTVLDAVDLTAFADHDFKASGAGDIGGVDWDLYNPTKVASMALAGGEIASTTDGATQAKCWDPGSYWDGSLLYAAIEDILPAWTGVETFAVQWLWNRIDGWSNYYDGAGLWLANSTVPAAKEAVGGTVGTNGVTPIENQIKEGNRGFFQGTSMQPFWEVVHLEGGLGAMFRCGAAPVGDWPEPGAWTPVYKGLVTPEKTFEVGADASPFMDGSAGNVIAFHTSQGIASGGPMDVGLGGFRVLVP